MAGRASLASGAHAITAVYAGDANYQLSTSHLVNQVVNRNATTTTLTSGLNPSTFGQTVTFTAKVTSSVMDRDFSPRWCHVDDRRSVTVFPSSQVICWNGPEPSRACQQARRERTLDGEDRSVR